MFMKRIILIILCILTTSTLFGQRKDRASKMPSTGLNTTKTVHFESLMLASEGMEAQLGLLISIPYSQLDFQWSTDRDRYIADAELIFGVVDSKSHTSKDQGRRWGGNNQTVTMDLLEDAQIDTSITVTLTTENLGTVQDSIHTLGIVWTLPMTYVRESNTISAMLYSGDTQRPLKSSPEALSKLSSRVYPVTEQGDNYCAQSITPSLAYNTDARLLWLSTAQMKPSAQQQTAEARFYVLSDFDKNDKSSTSSVDPLLPVLNVVAQRPTIVNQDAFAAGQLCVPKRDEYVSEVFDGKSLPNERIAIRIGKERFTWQSVWQDMPRSLRNIDIAIQSIGFIEDEKVVNPMMKGSALEKKEAFFEFWSPKDPTEGTHYNELMVEFYRRVDQAAEEFSTPSMALLDSDQAKVFIRYGEPDSKTRAFPPGGKTQETWRYGQSEFLFEASTGFGDFVLISPNSL